VSDINMQTNHNIEICPKENNQYMMIRSQMGHQKCKQMLFLP